MHRERVYVGDTVVLSHGRYSCSYLNEHNPPGCVRPVVSVEIDRHGCRRAWVQLVVPGGKQNPTHGWVAPDFDGYKLHKRTDDNLGMYHAECSILN